MKKIDYDYDDDYDCIDDFAVLMWSFLKLCRYWIFIPKTLNLL